MRTMNWKDNNSGGSVARASAAVGGRYEVTRAIAEAEYGVYYIPPYGDRKDPDLIHYLIHYPRGVPGTLAEAKQMAEEDHEKRSREALESAAL